MIGDTREEVPLFISSALALIFLSVDSRIFMIRDEQVGPVEKEAVKCLYQAQDLRDFPMIIRWVKIHPDIELTNYCGSNKTNMELQKFLDKVGILLSK